MRSVGYHDAELTSHGSDGGVDVIATGAVAQVKAEMVRTGRPVIQALHGIAALHNVSGYVFSLAGYTQQAIVWAEQAGVRLFRFDLQGVPNPVNEAALCVGPPSLARAAVLPLPLRTGDAFTARGIAATLMEAESTTSGWLDNQFIWRVGLPAWDSTSATALAVITPEAIGVSAGDLAGWDVQDTGASYLVTADTPLLACEQLAAELACVLARVGRTLNSVIVGIDDETPHRLRHNVGDPHYGIEPVDPERLAATIAVHDMAIGTSITPLGCSEVDVNEGRAHIVSSWWIARLHPLERDRNYVTVATTVHWTGLSHLTTATTRDLLALVNLSETVTWNHDTKVLTFFSAGTDIEEAASRAVDDLDCLVTELHLKWSYFWVGAGGNF